MADLTSFPAPDANFSLEDLPRPTKKYHTKPYERIALKNTGFIGSGKTVFVTGGATGVGLSIATAFAKAGVERIIIMSRSPGPLEKAKASLESLAPGLKVTTHSVSITDHARVKSILQESHPIDILVHSAAAAHDFNVLPHEIPVADMQNVYDTNVIGPFNVLSTFVALPAPGPGRTKTFINISTASTHFLMPQQIGYGSSKAAFAQMVQHFAIQEETKPKAEDRARLFNIHPGAFYTDMAKRYVAESTLAWEDIALPADYSVWLAGPQSDFLHGRFVWPHWDLEEIIAMKEKFQADQSYLRITLVK